MYYEKIINIDDLRMMAESVGLEHRNNLRAWNDAKNCADDLARAICGISGVELSIPKWKGRKLPFQMYQFCLEAERLTENIDSREILSAVSKILFSISKKKKYE